MSRFPARRSLSLPLLFAAVMVVAGAVTFWFSNSTIAILTGIGKCEASGYAGDNYMVACAGVPVANYNTAAMFLGVEQRAIDYLSKADVVVLGNSRTHRSFSAPAFQRYFAGKGLTHYVLAAEGSGFRFSSTILARQQIRPKILLINLESFYADKLNEIQQQMVDQPQRNARQYGWFATAQWLQRRACSPAVTAIAADTAGVAALLPERFWSWLAGTYCNGTLPASWRSARDGTVSWVPPARLVNKPIVYDRQSRLGIAGKVLRNARAFYREIASPGSCSILYLVPSPLSSPALGEKVAAELEVAWVFPEVPGLQTYDRSHMDPQNSEVWATAFTAALDNAIDHCLTRTKG